MVGPLIATKLNVPLPRLRVVERPRLGKLLDRALEVKLALISAPAGFGKTTLLAEWVGQLTFETVHIAWLSLDETDNEPAAFWPHVLATLKAAASRGGSSFPEVPGATQPDQAFIAILLNELMFDGRSFVLVLDDFHLVDRADIHAHLGLLIEHLPPNVHVVISTRVDPHLALARLRARGDLVEVRAADLRFTASETSAYLSEVMHLSLSDEDALRLEKRTEGWIAALQLAALSLQGREDATEFIGGFAGDDRYVVDYLVEEVLQRQPERVQHFLMQTCLLGRLTGSLCDAVSAAPGSSAMLESLVRSNLFLIPLDTRADWYRYHHLFAEALKVHFAADLEEEGPLIHQRASDWFAANDAPAEAIRHALAAKDFLRAADLIERAIPALSQNRQEPTIRAWLQALPDDLVRQRPILGIGLVGSLVSIGAVDGIEGRLRDIETAVAAAQAGDDTIVADYGQLPAVPGAVELYRAALAQVRGDLPAVIAHAERSIELAPKDEHFGRAGAQGFLGIAHWSRGELDAALRAWTSCREGLRRAGRVPDVMGASTAIADIYMTLGQLRAAARVWEDALQLSSEQNHVPRGTADVHAGLAEIYWGSGDIELASQHVVRAQELGQLAGLPQFPHRWRAAMANIRLTAGDPEGALDLLEEAERVYMPDFYPNVRPIAAMKARILIRQGRLSEAQSWQAEAGLDDGDELSYVREFEHVTLARLLLAQGGAARENALGLLARLAHAADSGGRVGSLIEILVLQTVAMTEHGSDAAHIPLDRALALAEQEGFVRVFTGEGEAIAAPLRTAAKRGHRFARLLLTDLGNATLPRTFAQAPDDLIVPLSERELDVLRFLRSDLDGPEIARELKVSLNTMRTHTKSIYQKLGVNGRRAAVLRAEELKLLRPR